MATTLTAPGWLLPCDHQARLLTSPSARLPSHPWTRYLRLAHGQLVGGGGFVGAPLRGEVEIGYFTLPGWQQLGHGQATAATLLAIARVADAQLTVTATTVRMPGSAAETSPSGRILQRLGFGPPLPAHDAEAGLVWHWAAGPLKPVLKPARKPALKPTLSSANTSPPAPERTSPCPVPP